MASEYNMNASTVAQKIAASAVASVPNTAAIPEIKAAIERAIVNAPVNEGVAVVGIKSSFLSKINWTQAIGWVASGIVAFLLPYFTAVGLPEQVVAMFTVQTVTAFLTWLFRTFFTSTVTQSSLPATL